jgi:hypothetical protein
MRVKTCTFRRVNNGVECDHGFSSRIVQTGHRRQKSSHSRICCQDTNETNYEDISKRSPVATSFETSTGVMVLLHLVGLKTHIQTAPRAAAILNIGTVYTMKRHSLCPSCDIRQINATAGHVMWRALLSTKIPSTASGPAAMRSFGRCAVKYACLGET